MYCIITTCSVECYWHCSDGTVHYKSDKTVNFCGFRCATTSFITVFINFVFCIYNSKDSTSIHKNYKCRKREKTVASSISALCLHRAPTIFSSEQYFCKKFLIHKISSILEQLNVYLHK